MLRFTVSAPHTDQGAITCLFNNIDLIIANRDKILSRNEYKHIKIPGLYVGGLYVGMYDLLLGDILILWHTTKWRTNHKYFYNIIGTPLSGMNTAHWYNAETHKIESGAYSDAHRHFLGLAEPALNYLKTINLNRNVSNMSIFDLISHL